MSMPVIQRRKRSRGGRIESVASLSVSLRGVPARHPMESRSVGDFHIIFAINSRRFVVNFNSLILIRFRNNDECYLACPGDYRKRADSQVKWIFAELPCDFVAILHFEHATTAISKLIVHTKRPIVSSGPKIFDSTNRDNKSCFTSPFGLNFDVVAFGRFAECVQCRRRNPQR